jgi:hypothetical protein
MNIITGNKIQTSKRTDYYPANHGCDCFTCTPFTPVENCFTSNGIRDWKIGSKGCCGCPSKPHCVSPDKRECSIGLSSKEKDPYKSIKWNKVSPNIECQYDINHIDTIDQVNNYRIKYEKNPLFKEHYTRIMRNFCNAVDTKNCINNMKSCSLIKSNSIKGNMCRNWFFNASNKEKDAFISNHCIKHNTEDCKCVNRTQDNSYKLVKKNNPINDGCWYKPCIEELTGNNLIPSSLINPECPDQLCQTIIDLVDTGNVNIHDVENNINCNFHNEEESNVPKFDPEDVKIIEKIHDNLLNGNKFIEENHWLFIYIIIVIILIIFLF